MSRRRSGGSIWRSASSPGVVLGFNLARFSGPAIVSLTRWRDRRKSGTTPEKVERKLKPVARRIAADAQGTADLVLDRAPHLEAKVHELLWRSATGSDAARQGLEALIAQVAPEVAADRQAAAAAFVQQLEDAKKQGKF
ncbi:hypothetical protein FB561_0415 [Kribbella amoyensis]|uniref:Uncharacterized protein n=1 Tax=Kribbella amoyensis TaxID=996641 RepID=A0A561BKF1_9ACTN|nr:hypothetical protein [Kribbella amoyensis]TWD79358.1 hypothetical protein FB561_0415 [Kribbella amoyensis]